MPTVHDPVLDLARDAARRAWWLRFDRTAADLAAENALDAALDAALDVLAGAGRYQPPGAVALTASDVEETARWLAEQSGFPRYAGDRWSLVAASEADVETAHRHAARAAAGDTRRLEELAAARRILIGHVRARQ